jgi:hypothetical protein
LLTVGLRGTPCLCTLGSPYSLGGLEPDGRSCLLISSVSVGFLVVVWFFVVSIKWDPGECSVGWIFKKGCDLFVFDSVENHSCIALSAGRMVSSVFFFFLCYS